MPDSFGAWVPKKCGAKTLKEGKPCMSWAMRGGDYCQFHGGPRLGKHREQMQQNVRENQMRAMVVTYGGRVDITPAEAIMEEISRTAGHVRWLEVQVASLDQSELIWGKVSQTQRHGIDDMQNWGEEQLAAVENLWLRLYFRERKHLADICVKALALGIAQEQVRIASNVAGMFEAAMLGILADVGIDISKTKVRAAVAQRMFEASSKFNLGGAVTITPPRPGHPLTKRGPRVQPSDYAKFNGSGIGNGNGKVIDHDDSD